MRKGGDSESFGKEERPIPEPKPTGVPSDTMHGFTKHAFISHSSKDHAVAEQICEVLETHGVMCWIAPRDIDPGAPYDKEIVRGIKSAQTFILLLSDAADASPHVKRELQIAQDAGHAVYPIRIQEVEPGPNLEYLLKGIHWVDAWTPPLEAHLNRLAALIISGHSPNVDSHQYAPARKQPLKQRWKGRMAMLLIAVLLAALAVGWFVLVYDRPPSPKKIEVGKRAEYATRITMAKNAVSTQLWAVATNCYAEAIELGKAIASFDYSEAQIGHARAARELTKENGVEQKQIRCNEFVANARVAESSRQWKEAVKLYGEALKLNDTPETRAALARIQGAMTEEHDAFIAKAKLAESKGQWQEAIKACKAALELADDPETRAALLHANEGLAKQAQDAQNQAQFDRLMAEAAQAQTSGDLPAALTTYTSAAAAAPTGEACAQAQDKTNEVRRLIKTAFDTLDRKAAEAQEKGNLSEAVDILEKALAAPPDKSSAARMRTRIDELQFKIAHPTAPVDQTVMLTWSDDPKAEKSHPESAQILDELGNVIGEVSLSGTDKAEYYGYHSATLSFKKGKEETVICVFREGDTTEQIRLGKAEELSFSGRVVSISRKVRSDESAIDALTIEVTATSDAPNKQKRPAQQLNVAPPTAPVNQTLMLSWSHDPKAEKSHPESVQVLDELENVIGEVSLKGSDPDEYSDDSCHNATLSFKKGKEETIICVFREGDTTEQVRLGKAEELSFSGRVVSINRKKERVEGTIDSLTIEVIVTSDAPNKQKRPAQPAGNAQAQAKEVVATSDALTKQKRPAPPAVNAQDKARQDAAEQRLATFNNLMIQGLEAERSKDWQRAKAIYSRALATAPDAKLALRARTRGSQVMAFINSETTPNTPSKQPVNQTVTISLFSGTASSSAQICDAAGKIVGTVSMSRESDFVGGVTVTFKGKQTTTLCDFSRADSVGATEVMNVEGISLTVQISAGEVPDRLNLRAPISVTVKAARP